MKVCVFAGSMRKESFNKKFAKEAFRFLAALPDVSVTHIDIEDFNVPLYNGDFEQSDGIPFGVKQLGKIISGVDALVISTPEYNGSIPGVLKNLVDWLSREKPVSLTGKHLLLLAASPGALGGVRSLWHTRVPFEVLGVHVFPAMMGLPGADKAFNPEGQLIDEKRTQQLKDLLQNFVKHGKPLTSENR